MVQRFIPYPAVACASTINTVLMRNHELTEGIEVVDDKGNVVGTSKIAAKKVGPQQVVVTPMHRIAGNFGGSNIFVIESLSKNILPTNEAQAIIGCLYLSATFS